MATRKYGFKKSPKDERDLQAKAAFSVDLNLPASVDLEPFMGPVKDQGQEGSCTAHAGSENLEFLFRKIKNESPVFSPQFLYYKEREMDGSLPGDNGSYGRTSVKVMQQFGCDLLSDDPYDIQKMDDPPTQEQLDNAAKYKAGAYHALKDVNEMKCCLASGFPFLLGFDVYENFEGISSDGIAPSPSGQVLGGHEVLVIGYDDLTGRFKVRNSWGSSWGKNGNFFILYDDLLKVMSEAWIQHFGKPWQVPMKKYWDLAKADFIKYMPWSATFMFYWFVVWNDYISSMLSNYIPEVQEQNPFARNQAMHFVLHKGMVVDLFFGAAFFLTVLVGYHIVKHWNKTFATIAANGFILYHAFDRLIGAVVTNYLYALHLYIKDPHPSIFNIFGL